MSDIPAGVAHYRIKSLERDRDDHARMLTNLGVTVGEQGTAIALLAGEVNEARADVKEIKTGQARVTAALYTLATSAILLAATVVLTR